MLLKSLRVGTTRRVPTELSSSVLCLNLVFAKLSPRSSSSWAELALFSVTPADGLHNIAYGLHNIADRLHNIADGLLNIAHGLHNIADGLHNIADGLHNIPEK